MNKNRHLVVNSYGEPNGNGTEHDDMILGEDVGQNRTQQQCPDHRKHRRWKDLFHHHSPDSEHLQQQSCHYLHEEESSG